MVSTTVYPWWVALMFLALLGFVIVLLLFLTARRNARYFAEQRRLNDAIDEANRRDPPRPPG